MANTMKKSTFPKKSQLPTGASQPPWYIALISKTLEFEVGGNTNGGYTNDPSDSGGETKWGISKKAHPELNIKDLTKEQAIEVYVNDYLNYNVYFIHPTIGFKIFDMGVLQGRKTSEKIFQEVLSKISGTPLKIDGKIGIVTVTIYNNYIYPMSPDANLKYNEANISKNVEKLYTALVDAYARRLKIIAYLKPKNHKYLKGWLTRVNFRFTLPTPPLPIELKKGKNAS